MAGEIQTAYSVAGVTLYAHVRNSIGQIWNTALAAFQAYATANIADYDIALAQQGTASRYYVGTFPAAAAGTYQVVILLQAGGAPSETDVYVSSGSYEWDGSAVIPLSSRLATSGYTAPPSAASIAAAVWASGTRTLTDFGSLAADTATAVGALVVETGYGLIDVLKSILASTTGESSGGPGTQNLKAPDGVTTRVVIEADADGNRTSSTLTP